MRGRGGEGVVLGKLVMPPTDLRSFVKGFGGVVVRRDVWDFACFS